MSEQLIATGKSALHTGDESFRLSNICPIIRSVDANSFEFYVDRRYIDRPLPRRFVTISGLAEQGGSASVLSIFLVLNSFLV